jgi:uncharacterized protein (TIGR00369 family)
MSEQVVQLHGHDVAVRGFAPDAVVGAMAEARVAFNDLVGLTWAVIAPDHVEARLTVVDDHLQPSGVVHGGVYCTLVEATGSTGSVVHVASAGRAAMGVHNATSFVRPTRAGDTLTAVATPVHLGRTQHLWDVRVTRADGKLAAKGELRTAIVTPRHDR